ncbi:GntR family transcriptional regulator [Sporolactobacillus terrae]|uniref:GntR family transcriptional regulator n=1 Tax=Sporolactobacillus terrae TaxID=269673 RepID=UPI00048FF647|nr:GntR family transcriptional regulator [Sporolactobacillus terrae]
MRTEQAASKRIIEALEYKIEKAIYKSGDKLPSEHDLCNQFSVNPHFVRFAFLDLIHRGLVESKQGKGYFVAKRMRELCYPLSSLTRFTENLNQIGIAAEGKLVDWTLRLANEPEAERLQLTDDQHVYELQIIRCAGDQPFSRSQTVLPKQCVPNFSTNLENFRSLYQLLDRHYRIYPHRVSSTLQAVMPNQQDTEQLNIPENVPILQVRSLTHYPKGRPIEYSCSRIRSDLCRCTIDF